MPPTKSLRPAGPALTPSETTLTVLSDPSLTNPYVPSTFTDGLPLPRLMVFDLDYTLWPFWCDTHCSPPLKPAKDSGSNKKGSTTDGLTTSGAWVNNKMVDRWGENFAFYTEVPNILAAAKEKGIALGVASRTHTPDIARDLLKGLMVPVYPSLSQAKEIKLDKRSKDGATAGNSIRLFKAIDFFPSALQQIYPGSKTKHFKKIHEACANSKVIAGIPELKTAPVDFQDMIFFDDEARNRNVETELGVTFWLVRDGVGKDEVDRGVREWRRRRGFGKKISSASASTVSKPEISELEG